MIVRFLAPLVALAVGLNPAIAAEPSKPMVTAQTQPVGKILADLKLVARTVAGDGATKVIDNGLKEFLGEKGFAGLDLSRHFLGYMNLSEKPENFSGVLMLPITEEAAFKDLLTRIGGGRDPLKLVPVDGKKGLFKVESRNGEGDFPIHARFANGYCYFGLNIPVADFTSESLIKPGDLLVGQDQSFFVYRLHLDRIPEKLKKIATKAIEEFADIMGKEIPVHEDLEKAKVKLFKELGVSIKNLANRLASEGETFAGGYRFDPQTMEVYTEAVLTPKKGSKLATEIAAKKPHQNQFAGLLSKETAAGGIVSLPTFYPEFGDLLVLFAENEVKNTLEQLPDMFHPVIKELVAGAKRTVRSGAVDAGVAVNGPDKDGHFTLTAAISFEDTAKLEKAVRDLHKKAPEAITKHIKLDVGKVGDVSVHEVSRDLLPAMGEGKQLPAGNVSVAFAPKAIYISFGPDGVSAIKAAIAATKPIDARPFDLVFNPKRLHKFVAKFDNEAADQFASFMGTEDELISFYHFQIKTGEEYRMQFGMSVKGYPKLIFKFLTPLLAPPPCSE